jgi:hypothetical protein
MKISIYILIVLLSSCQGGGQQRTLKKELISQWPNSIKKIIIYCSSDQQIIEVTKENYREKHDCQDLPGASHISPIFSKENLSIRIKVKAIQHVTIMNEGPHIDLTNWKSVSSEYKDLLLSQGKYKLENGPFSSFPAFKNIELVNAAEKLLKTWGGAPRPHWLELAKKCGTDPNKYPCGLGISGYKVRLEVPEEDSVIEFQVAKPMGC